MARHNEAKYWVIIPAAGVGTRMGVYLPKQYLSLHGKTVLEHTITKFLYHPKVEKIVVAVNEYDHYWSRLGLTTHTNKIIAATGGKERHHSVRAALNVIAQYASSQDFVLVHDAVRPCVTHSDIDKLIATVGEHPVGGILGTKVRDTLKYFDEKQQVLNTLPRENVWHALTPQMFRLQLLTQALDNVIKKNLTVTDEACAIETLGFVPMIIEGRTDNIKITFKDDLSLAEKYLTS